MLEPVFVECGCFLLMPDEFLDVVTGQFSEIGSNSREREVDIFKFFNDFVQGCWERYRYLIFISNNLTLYITSDNHLKCSTGWQ